MVAWLLYATATGVGICVAGLLAERGLRCLGRPARWVWAVAMVATVGVPLAAVVAVEHGALLATAPASGWDTLILIAWAAVSLVTLASVRLSLWTVRRNARSWRPGTVDGESVLVSTSFGPGVIGARRPRIVLPVWVEGTPEWLRRLVVRHEAEHMRAGDTKLLLGGVVVVALVPWLLPLWWQLHRLRAAVESDCDARVLATADRRAYANALVAIAGRPTRRLLPVPTLAPRATELERRLRLITGTGGPRKVGLALAGLALAVLLALGSVPAPAALPAPLIPTLNVAAPTSSFEQPREARVFLSVQPEVVPAGD